MESEFIYEATTITSRSTVACVSLIYPNEFWSCCVFFASFHDEFLVLSPIANFPDVTRSFCFSIANENGRSKSCRPSSPCPSSCPCRCICRWRNWPCKFPLEVCVHIFPYPMFFVLLTTSNLNDSNYVVIMIYRLLDSIASQLSVLLLPQFSLFSPYTSNGPPSKKVMTSSTDTRRDDRDKWRHKFSRLQW